MRNKHLKLVVGDLKQGPSVLHMFILLGCLYDVFHKCPDDTENSIQCKNHSKIKENKAVLTWVNQVLFLLSLSLHLRPSTFSSAFAVSPFPPRQVHAATARFCSKLQIQLKKNSSFDFPL